MFWVTCHVRSGLNIDLLWSSLRCESCASTGRYFYSSRAVVVGFLAPCKVRKAAESLQKMQRWFVLSSRRQKSDWWCLYAWCLNEFRFDFVSISDINLVFLVDAVQRENQKLALKLIGMNCWHGQHTLKGMLKSHRFQWHLLQILAEHPDFMVKLMTAKLAGKDRQRKGFRPVWPAPRLNPGFHVEAPNSSSPWPTPVWSSSCRPVLWMLRARPLSAGAGSDGKAAAEGLLDGWEISGKLGSIVIPW